MSEANVAIGVAAIGVAAIGVAAIGVAAIEASAIDVTGQAAAARLRSPAQVDQLYARIAEVEALVIGLGLGLRA